MTTNNNGPVIYGLLQSILSKESEEKPVENEIIKKMIEILKYISHPIVSLIYNNNNNNEIPLKYTQEIQVLIILILIGLALVLFLSSGGYEIFYKKSKSSRKDIQFRTISYMTCIWIIMFVLIIIFFPRL
jgi:hypothetical protein